MTVAAEHSEPVSRDLRGLRQPFINHYRLTITGTRSSNRSQTWALSYSNVLRRDAQSQLALKPSPSAFAAFLKHGSKCIVLSAGTSMERRYGSLQKPRLQCASAKALRSEQTQIGYTRRSVFSARAYGIFPSNRSLQFCYSTSAMEPGGRKEPGYRAMHRASTNIVEIANGTHQLRANVRQSFKRRSIHFDAR